MGVGFIVDYIVAPNKKSQTVRISVAHPSTGLPNFLSIDVVKRDYRFSNRWVTDNSRSNIYTEAAGNSLWRKGQPYRPLLGLILKVGNETGMLDDFGVRMKALFGDRETMNIKEDPEAMTVYEYVNDLKEHAVFSAYKREDDF